MAQRLREPAPVQVPVQETKSPHAAGQLSLHAKTARPELTLRPDQPKQTNEWLIGLNLKQAC